MPSYTSFDTRMKIYEKYNTPSVFPEMPIIVRLDGVCFHTFCKQYEKPFSKRLKNRFTYAVSETIKLIPDVRMVYYQSDEVNLLLWYKRNEQSQPWFGNKRDKFNSVIASKFTTAFNEGFLSDNTKGLFDCRSFWLPFYEVENYFIWRQGDCIRNSIHMLGRSYYSQKQLHGVSNKELVQMLSREKGDPYAVLENEFKLGSTIIIPDVDFDSSVKFLNQRDLFKGLLNYE